MLVLKKMSVKKLASYIIIIVIMLIATGFVLKENYKLSGGSLVTPNNQVLVVDRPTEIESIILGGGTSPNQPLIDLNIFGSEKFKSLQEHPVVSQDQVSTGKKDPFKPN